MLRVRFVAAIVMFMTLAATTCLLVAQDNNQPGGQRGPGGPRGQRGPGGGFFGGGRGMGMRGDPTLQLLQMPEVRKELELVDDQEASLRKVQEEAMGQLRPQINFQDLSEEERQKAFADFQQKAQEVTKKAKAQIDEILLPHQQDRLKELSIQMRRTRALQDEDVAAALELTAEQKQKLETVQRENDETSRTKMREIFEAGRQGGGAGEGIREKMAELQKENDAKLLAVLTDAQKQKFESLKGKPFEFPRPQFGPGGGPGGQPRGPGQREGNRPRGAGNNDNN